MEILRRSLYQRLREFIAQENPAIGKPIEDLPQYRDLFIRFGAAGYVLRYRIHLDSIYIVHIQHYREVDFQTQMGTSYETLSL